MEREVFEAGTAPGSPATSNEVKTLICYLLFRAESPLSFSQIHESLQEESLVNYFELSEALKQLVLSGHLELKVENEIEHYLLNELGLKTAKELETSLTPSVRSRAWESLKRTIDRQRRLSEVDVKIDRVEDGYSITLVIPDKGTDILRVLLFAPTMEECQIIRRRFLNDPIFIYKAILALLRGDKNTLGELIPSDNNLF